MQLRKVYELDNDCQLLCIRYQMRVFGKMLFSVVTKRFKNHLNSI